MAINFIQGAARAQIVPGDVETLSASGALVQDPRRQRPRYFDGRFLAARDLIRDQQYFLTREADLGQAAGAGVAGGLAVTAGATPQSLRIAAGQGITPAGELVLLASDVALNLADIPLAEQYSVSFGIARTPATPMISRTGLFILALRPVEFTANPIGAYPTTLSGPRTVQDGDVIEAAAIVLVPYQDDGAADDLLARRGRAARTIFTQSTQAAASTNVLPLAMLALQSNNLVWIDEAMVRRELGADRGDLPGLGFAPRALRLAHLLQHQRHLADVVAQVGGKGFPASTQFPALPPAGPLPPGVIDSSNFTQRYFPSEVDVDFSVIPDDELAALVEESLALPPIDLLASEATLDLTAVLVLVPIARAEFSAQLAKLTSRTRPLKPAAPNLIALRKPLEILQGLRLPLPLTPVNLANPVDAEWARLAQLPSLWYVRRRNLAWRDDLVGTPATVAGTNDIAVEHAVRERVAALGLQEALQRVLGSATAKASAAVYGLLAAPRVAASPALTAATIGALASQVTPGDPPALGHAGVVAVSAQLGQPGVGDGLERLERRIHGRTAKTALVALASNDAWRKLDTQARTAPANLLAQLSARLTRVATPPAPPAQAVPVEAPAAPKKPAARKAAASKTASAKPAKKTAPAKRTAAAAKSRPANKRA
jgi:hypothetical protein